MFRVHQPAHSYFKKQLRTYGSAELLMALDPILLKSALLHYLPGGEGNVGRVHTWGPEEGMSDDLNTPDHPPWSHNPNTGKLIFDPQTGRPWGNHPIDYVHQDLQRKFNFSPEAAKQLINRSIDRYNRNGGQELPGFDDPRWRKVFYGPYIDEKTPARDRQVFGTHAAGMPEGMKPLITYSLPKGFVDHPQADQGTFIDGGHVHFHHELGEELREMMRQAGMSPAKIEQDVDLPYINDSALKTNHLTRGPNGQTLVQSWSRQDLENAIASGSIPANYRLQDVEDRMHEQRTHGEVHAHQIAHMLPDTFYHAQTSKSGGRPRKLAEGQQQLSAGEELAQVMSEAGLDVSQYSPEELEQMGGTKAIKMLFSRTQGQKNKAGGAAKMALREIFAQLGSSHEDLDYELHRTNARHGTSRAGPEYHGTANLRAADVVAHLSNLVGKYEDEGMSAEKAKQKAVSDFRNYDHTSKRYGPVEGLREKTEALIGQMMGAHGHEKFELGDRPTQHVRSGLPMGIGETQTQVPDHWAKRNLSGNLDRPTPMGQEQVAYQPTMAPPTFTPEVTPSQYSMGPGQVQFSSDNIMHGLDDIRKKMGYFDGFLRGF
tara:strand:+ start:4793 stop:6592 length:1800 start_codon:yes stop_codon:yes gene_type:complete